MKGRYRPTRPNGGAAPATPGFNAVAPEWLSCYGAAVAAPVIPAAESTLGSHPCVALSSAQVISEWINRSLAVNAFPANGDNPLNFVSQPRGSLHIVDAVSEERIAAIEKKLESFETRNIFSESGPPHREESAPPALGGKRYGLLSNRAPRFR